MPKLAIHPVGLAVTIFGLLVWIIALGGVGAATSGCQSSNSYEFCAKTYQVSSCCGSAANIAMFRRYLSSTKLSQPQSL